MEPVRLGFKLVWVLSSCVAVEGRLVPPPTPPPPPAADIHVLIPGNCNMLPYMAKEAVKLRILRREIILDYLAGPNVITRVLTRGRGEGQIEKGIS